MTLALNESGTDDFRGLIERSALAPLVWSEVDQAVAEVDGFAPDQIEKIKSLPHFKLFTGAFTAGASDADGAIVKTLHCTASSTVEDLHGDVMTQECVRDMAKQARKGPQGKGLTIFLNHRYSAPEDVAGRVTAASAQATGEKDDAGAEVWDLHYDIALTKNNSRVDQVHAQVMEGISLGVSIGAYILEYDYKDKEEGFWGGLIINKVLLVETSIVGIPANQRSWVQNAVMAIGKHLGLKELFDSSEPDFRLEKRLWKVLDGKETAPLMKTASLDASQPVLDEQATATEADGSSDITDDNTVEASAETDESTAAPVQESTAEPTEQNDAEQAVETTDASPSALEAAAPEIAASLESGTQPALELVLAALEHAATELRDLRAASTEKDAQILALTGERDKAIKDAEDAAKIVAVIARSPLGRKTGFQQPVQSFAARFGAIYDQAFLNILDQDQE